jgi:hypothetical protein
MVERKTAAWHDVRNEPVRKCDRETRLDERALAGSERDRFGSGDIRSGITGVCVCRDFTDN